MNIFEQIFNNLFLYYGSLLFATYILIGVLSSFGLIFYARKNKHFRYNTIRSHKLLPSVAIIAPAYNEEKSIVENIRSLLSLEYPTVKVIIVNDGSTDNSVQKVIKHYRLEKVDYAYTETVKTATIKGVYQSTDSAYANLIFIDKENGGKSDALNAGLNISRSDLFLAIDVDCIIEPDAILKMVKPFIEEADNRKVIASGGVVRVANSCEIEDGRIKKVVYPKNIWAKFQVLEYFRAFTLGRMAWSKINGLLIISGAFGLFDRRIAIAAGGYDTSTVGEDLELVVRMRKYMHKVEKKKYRVAFIPDPLCWTEVPSSAKVLSRQRRRWTKGSIDTILKHKDMFFNPKYGKIGMISFPYWVFFEWLAPIIETIGILYFLFMLFFGFINYQVFFILLLFVFALALTFSSFAVFYETYFFGKYKGSKVLANILFLAVAEMFIFHPMNVYFAIRGNFEYFFKGDKKTWGNMNRTAFDANINTK